MYSSRIGRWRWAEHKKALFFSLQETSRENFNWKFWSHVAGLFRFGVLTIVILFSNWAAKLVCIYEIASRARTRHRIFLSLSRRARCSSLYTKGDDDDSSWMCRDSPSRVRSSTAAAATRTHATESSLIQFNQASFFPRRFRVVKKREEIIIIGIVITCDCCCCRRLSSQQLTVEKINIW